MPAKTNSAPKGTKVIVQVKPARRPFYWPADDTGHTAWATITVTRVRGSARYAICGYSIGVDPSSAVPTIEAAHIIKLWRQEDSRKWLTRKIPV